jgi:enediyne polyketide synthase
VGAPCDVRRRPGGRPEILGAEGRAVSSAHAGALTLAICGRGPIGGDIEWVVPRAGALWNGLLGPERFGLASLIAGESGEGLDRSATRIWAAGECLIKAGVPVHTPLTLFSGPPSPGPRGGAGDAWICLAAGGLTVATCVLAVAGQEDPLALAVAARSDHAQL